jgi:S-DNA-T family DNA segregation ATPase FtsK/SpoIIIE
MANGSARASKKSGAFLPDGSTAFFRKLAGQAIGVVAIAAGIAVIAALATYDARDPSFNTSASGAAANMLGTVGAYVSDALLQWFGLAAWLPALFLLIWGARLTVAAKPFDRPGIRLLMVLASILLIAIGLADIAWPAGRHMPAFFGVHGLLGGSAGRLLLSGLAIALSLVHGGALLWVAAVVAGILGLVCAGWAMGLTLEDWRTIRRFGARLLAFARWVSGQSRAARIVDPAGGVRARKRREPSFDHGAADDLEDDEAEPEIAPSRIAPSERAGRQGRREREERQGKLGLPEGDYALPPLQLLAPPPAQSGPGINEDALNQNARLLESVLDDFGVNGEITKVRPGPVVTLYELEPAPGTKTSRVIGLSDDIARQMSALSVRIATVPGRSVIGIELPNARRETVSLRELLASDMYERAPAPLTLVLGKDIGGQPVMVDLARMPHLLIAGTTGSGKSVAINTMILSLLYRLRPQDCRLIMIDPKMLELSVYDGIPHLLAPVVTEAGKAVVALKWAVREMENRYRKMSQLGVRNITGYNQRLAEAKEKGEKLNRTVQTGFDTETGKPVYEDQELALDPLPFIVVVVDEMADLMLVAGKDIESAVQRLAQMARAAGIHLIMATQRPSVDVITGTIKANFPSRVSFQVSSKIDSRTILGEQGAEQLLGQGDMLYMAAGGRIIRVHGPFVADHEVEKVANHLRAQGAPSYLEEVTEEDEPLPAMGGGEESSSNDLYDQAVALVARERKVSTSYIQRRLQIGYNRAANLIERMEEEGVISRPNVAGKREVLTRNSDE